MKLFTTDDDGRTDGRRLDGYTISSPCEPNGSCELKINSFKSSENIQKKEVGSDRSVSDNQSSSVTLNELAMKNRKSYCNFKLQQRSHTMTDINPNEVQMI